MPVNSDKPLQWKTDIAKSVDYYNTWFIEFAPKTYRNTRIETTEHVVKALKLTNNLKNIFPELLKKYPDVLSMLRMATAPPIARDRLIGLANVSTSLINNMEKNNRIPPNMDAHELDMQLTRIGEIIYKLADGDIFTWLGSDTTPEES